MLLSGCGYSLAGRTASLIKGRSLHLTMFTNRTYQPNIEAEFRKALLDELALRGGDVRPEKNADLIISGEIDAAALAITAYSAVDTTVMNNITLTITMQLAEQQSGRIIWKSTETLRQDYPALADVSLQRNSRDAAITTLCTRMARIIVQNMDQAF